MDTDGLYRRLLAYDLWANREAFETIQKAGDPPKAVKWFSHIISVQWLYAGRIASTPPRMDMWPELTPEECEQQLGSLGRHWQEYTKRLTPAKLAEIVSYTNSQGEAWTSSVEDCLLQVVLHGAYHRGQIAAEVRAAGFKPSNTDYIRAAREEFIE